MTDIAMGQRASSMGIVFVAVTALGWGINFPITKFLLTEWPPMAARGLSAFGGAILLALLALARRESLRIASHFWGRLAVVSVLTVSSWAAGMGLALNWLKASEAAVFAVSAPLWVSVLAWPLLGERPTLRRAVGLVAAFVGVFVLIGGGGLEASFDKLPGALAALGAALANAFGTIAVKQKPFPLKPVALASWQMLIGCIPVALFGLLIERPDVAALTGGGWAALIYTTTVQFCLCYAFWFAALERLPASTASIGTLLVPVIGVVASAFALQEPIGLAQTVALFLTLVGVALAMRN